MSAVLVVNPSELGELLATQFSQYGIEAVHAKSGEQALEFALEDTPLAVVVDAELPDGPGIEYAELLAAELMIPVVLTHRPGLPAEDEDFLPRAKNLDALFRQPFRSLALIGKVADLCGMSLEAPLTSQEGAAAVPPGHDDDDDDDTLTELDVASEDVLSARTQKDPDGFDDLDIDDSAFEAALAEEEESSRMSAAPGLPADDIAAVAFDPADIALWYRRMRDQKAAGPAEHKKSTPPRPASLEGALSPPVLVDVLDAFHQSQSTGEVFLERGKDRRVILFRRGRIVGARSNIQREELAYIALAERALTPEQARQAAQAVREGKAKTFTGAILIENLLERDALVPLLEKRTRRVVIGAFTWADGRYRLSYRGLGKREPVPVDLSAGEAILRGILRTDRRVDLESAAPDDARFAPNPDAAYALTDLRLDDVEARLVVSMDGTKTVADLRTLFDDVPVRVVRGLAAGLHRLRMLRLAGRGPAAPRRIDFF